MFMWNLLHDLVSGVGEGITIVIEQAGPSCLLVDCFAGIYLGKIRYKDSVITKIFFQILVEVPVELAVEKINVKIGKKKSSNKMSSQQQ